MKFLYAAVILTSSLCIANACSCTFPAILKRDFFAPQTAMVIKGRVLSSGPLDISSGAMVYLIQTEVIYKGCNVNNIITATSPDPSAACGVSLQVGTSYIIPLSADVIPTLSQCQFVRKFDSLSEEDTRFLSTRQVCCGGNCECADVNTPFVSCFRPPCSPPEQPPCAEAVKCVENYCGDCVAEWFTAGGQYACLPSPF